MSENENTGTMAMLTKAEVKSKDFDYRAVVKQVREVNERIRKDHGNVMWNAAITFGEVKRRGLIGDKAGAAGWPTQVAYATAAGYSEAAGSLLNTLSVAIDLGLKVGSPEWADLVQGRKGMAKAVREAKTLTAFKAEAKRIRTAPPAKGKAKAPASERKSTTPKVKSTAKDCEAAIHALRLAFHDLDSKAWKTVREAMLREVKSEDNRRQLHAAKAAKDAAAKASATPADMPKVKVPA